MKFLSNRLAALLKRSNPNHPASEAVLAYGIGVVLNTLFVILLSILISIFTNKVLEVIAALLVFALLRAISGGFHFKSGVLCILVSSISANILTFITFSNTFIVVITFLNILFVLIYAPSGIENRTNIPVKFFPLLKILALLFVSINFVLMSSLFAATTFVQCIMLIQVKRREVTLS